MYSHHSKNGTGMANSPEQADEVSLLEVNGWELVRSKYPDMIGISSYPYHTKCKTGAYRVNRTIHTRPLLIVCDNCLMCGDPVPEEIHGLWVLHNWEVVTK